MTQPVEADYLKSIMTNAHERTMELVAGLDDEQMMGPKLPIVNPLCWEIGHVAWFQEKFILRDMYRREPLLPKGDDIYDSIAIHHDVRWDLPLLSMPDTIKYMEDVMHNCLDRLPAGMASEEDSYMYQFATSHQDMHTEAFTYTRQTLSYPEPAFVNAETPEDVNAGAYSGDAQVPGGTFMLGAGKDVPFLFDNEKWAHEVTIAPFHIAMGAVTNSQFAAFVDNGGYLAREYWSDEGWAWRKGAEAEHPVYWSRNGENGWDLRRFDMIIDLPPNQAIIHVNWHEAYAYCAWAKRRLPSEAEWDAAAICEPSSDGTTFAPKKRTYPWGEEPPDNRRANLDGRALRTIDVGSLPEGDSAFGCRQMLGNVWEWTSTTFAPFPGFSADAYKDYSQPVFYETKVLRGGAWPTRSRMITGRYRNFYTPDRRDVLAGFRTCAI